ncbi:Rpn family recombination-promoting nuclease/putative transposase [Paenibacillus sp. TH7-28]
MDIVGEEKRTLDLLLETRYLELDAYILIHIEPQSYRENDFHERMFIYFSRLFERHRKEYKLIIPIAIFTADEAKEEKNTLMMSTPQQPILWFEFMKVELRKQPWRQFIDSANPVAAALLAKMGYTKGEEREIRLAYLRMILRLQGKLDDARMALIMSVADQYFNADPEQDKRLLEELKEQYPEEGESIMKLMPVWSRLGYEEGLEEGLEKGIEQGIAVGVEKGIEKTALNMLREGMEISLVAKVTGLSEEQVVKLNLCEELVSPLAISEKKLRICDKGHRYYKSSDCPTCPICEQGLKPDTGFLSLLSNPARRALEHEGITTLQKLSAFTELEILQLHGIGPRSIPVLREALQTEGLAFKSGSSIKRKEVDTEEKP